MIAMEAVLTAHFVDSQDNFLTGETRRLETWSIDVRDEDPGLGPYAGALVASRIQREGSGEEPDLDELILHAELAFEAGPNSSVVWVSNQDYPLPTAPGSTIEDYVPEKFVHILNTTTGLDWSAALPKEEGTPA